MCWRGVYAHEGWGIWHSDALLPYCVAGCCPARTWATFHQTCSLCQGRNARPKAGMFPQRLLTHCNLDWLLGWFLDQWHSAVFRKLQEGNGAGRWDSWLLLPLYLLTFSLPFCVLDLTDQETETRGRGKRRRERCGNGKWKAEEYKREIRKALQSDFYQLKRKKIKVLFTKINK